MKSFKFILFFLPLFSSINGIKLQCKFDDYMYDKNYKCELENFKVELPNQVVTEISGLHIPRRTDADVIILSIDEQIVHYLPKGIDKFFPNIMYISIYKSGLKELTKDDLKNFPKLRNVGVRFNNIENLPGDLFEYNTEIASIGFQSNNIKRIGKDIFKSLNSLESVNLLRNVCINQQATNRSEIEEMMKQANDCYN